MIYLVSHINFRLLLLPFSFVYGFIIWLRNKLFDWGVLKEKLFEFPIISVGNITVGGTGKTPHIEYLYNLLKENFKIAVLSRGYKRKTQGFLLADTNSTPKEIGDEPYQIYRKYPSAVVAVCEKRVFGIEKLVEQNNNIKAILLDDAYQHRYVKPGLSILLIDYNRPVYKDFLLPAGNLRENIHQIKRANIIIVTKVPSDINSREKSIWVKKLNLSPNQFLFYSTFQYEMPQPVFINREKIPSLDDYKEKDSKILLITGIAEPKSLIDFFRQKGISFVVIRFSDHHNFSNSDLEKIELSFNRIKNRKKIIITTEKDAVRLQHLQDYPDSLKEKTYFLPISVQFLENKQNEFDRNILEYVGQS